MSKIRIQETDTTGAATKTYILTTTKTSSSDPTPTTRLDLITNTSKPNERSTAIASTQSFIGTHIAPLFLPHGYPRTVTPDYTPYQIYDSLQAFTSTIAGLLSSRAVLQSMGMDTEGSKTSTATYATLLSIARSTISNLSNILFADHMSSRVSSEVKFYRFLADIMNDAGFLLEMVSPSLPGVLKVPVLCLSSALRSMCGVAGGSSKAILSAHFALDGNIGELNAKDGSQETLVNLVGMWVGGVVVSRVESLWATWCWMLVLLALHLWFNWLAVTSVRLKGLNLTRSGMLFCTLIKEGRCESVDELGRRERVFGKSSLVQDSQQNDIVTGRIGVGMSELVRSLGGRTQVGSGTEVVKSMILQELLKVFEKEKYLVWFTPRDRKAVVLFKENASREDQLKAWCHTIRIGCQDDKRDEQEAQYHRQALRVISETLSINNSVWQDFRRQLEDAGWDINATTLESTTGTRLKIHTANG